MNSTFNYTFENAAGKIDYTLMNDYMFRAVLQENRNVLKGLTASLLHLKPETIRSAEILNPIELGKTFDDKTFVLDVKVLLNNAAIINLEMQVAEQAFWTDRSLSYLCTIFQNLERGDDYTQIKPAYHIGILDFSLFPQYPEFYAVNKMMNIKKHYIYNDNFTLNVLDLSHTELATEEDKAYKIDYWAKLFKAKTWEELKMIAQKDDFLKETCETVYNMNRNDEIRCLCEMREEGQRILRTYQSLLKNSREQLAENAAVIAENAAVIAENAAVIAENAAVIAEKDMLIAALQERIKALEAGK